MNAKNAAQYLPIVQAMADGKTIQHKTSRGWEDAENVILNSHPEYYRIKPDDVEIDLWISYFPESLGGGVNTISQQDMTEHDPDGKWVKTRFRKIEQ